jgi:microcystin degradation protein MlrC
VCVADVLELPFARRPKPLWPWEEDPWTTI